MRRRARPAGRAGRERRVEQPIAQIGHLRIETREERLRRRPPQSRSTSPCDPPRRRSGRSAGSRPRRTACAGTKSASSTQLAAASNTSGATRRQRQILDQNHSDEYVPPMGARYSGACARASAGDLRRLRRRRVVLPEPGMRGERAGPLRVQRERTRAGIDRQRRGPGRVDADADDALAGEAGLPVRLGQRAGDRRAEAREVVGRVLARDVRIARVEQHALVAARIVEHARAEQAPVGAVGDDRAHGVGAEVDADSE